MNRFGQGQAPSGNPLRKPRYGFRIQLTDRQRQICARCYMTRYEHERQGLVPDHDFVAPGEATKEPAK